MEFTNCQRCGRKLTAPASRKAGYGPTCAAKVRHARRVLDAFKPHQRESAWLLIDDNAIVPLRGSVFLAVSTDGSEVYRTHPTNCNCPAGLKGGLCYHQLAARLLLAA